MITEPAVSHERMAQALQHLYGLDVEGLRFLSPGGECSWSYIVEAAQGRFFLKLSQPRVCGGEVTERGLVAADALAQALDTDQIVTALRASTGLFLNTIDDYRAVLTPFVEGVAAFSAGLTVDQRRELGLLLARIHEYLPDMTVRPPHDAIARYAVRDWQALLAALEQPAPEWSPAQQQMAALLRLARDETQRLVAAYEALEQQIMVDRFIPLGFCHGDPTAGNILIRPDGHIVLIDWDSPVWAPLEHDLFFLRQDDEVMAAYRSAAGVVMLNETLFTIYQYAWDIGEIVDYGYRTLLTTQSDAQYAHDVRELTGHLRGMGLPV